ncbi:MAG TPA: GntR family transcriptional regulator [Pilimelia sp.]|nr:GntR family transcriptional regulator [Pilimelia sp.]
MRQEVTMPAMAERSLHKELLSDQVYEVIRRSIVSGEAQPGDRIKEGDIARELGVSQAPVREALKRLVHEGLVTYLPRRGNFVTEISAEAASDAREVRVVIEALAGRRLAAGAVRPEVIASLRDIVAQMRAAAVPADVPRFRDLDLAFHRRVCAAGGNSFVERVWQMMEPSLRTLRVVSDPLFSGSWAEMAELHADLVDVLEARDPDRAARLFAAHARGEASQA